jgi:hypothetical protein
VLETISLELVEAVRGGDRSTSTTTDLGPLHIRQSDYSRCLSTTMRLTAEQYPSTNPWWWPFGTDRNAQRRARATITNVRRNCGLPR